MKLSQIKLVMALMILLFEGCKNDDPAPDQSAELIGNWEVVTFVATGCNNPDDNYNETCTSNCEILVATATTLTIDGAGPYPYTTDGNSMTIDFGGDTFVITYSIAGEILTFSAQDSPADGGCKNVSTYKKYDNTVEDLDGNIYKTVFIGNQEWMEGNLKTKRYSDGSPIPNVIQASDWVNLSNGAYCDYNNEQGNVGSYGRFYNAYAVSDSRNVCPSGWHVPSLAEWDILIDNLGGENVAGGKMKSKGTVEEGSGEWHSPNTGATNSSGFTALPGGSRFDAGDFRDLHSFGNWRTSDGWTITLQDTKANVQRFYNYQTNGTSVRCMKN